MKINKIITTTIDVINAVDCYRPRAVVAFEYLCRKYEGGCCDSGCFISRIIRIVKISALRIDKNRNDGRMLMSVQYEAECFVFVRGEILPRFIAEQFISLGEQKLPIGSIHYGNQKVAFANIERVGMQAYKEGNVAPVIVKSVEYTIGQPATISAIGFQPVNRTDVIYRCEPDLSARDTEYIRTRLEKIRAIMKTYEGEQLRQFQYFSQMLCLAIKPRENVDGMQALDLGIATDLSALTRSVIYITRPMAVKYGSTCLWFTSVEQKGAIAENLASAIDTIINQIHLELSSIHGLMEAYPVSDLKLLKPFIDGYIALKQRDLK